MKRTRRSEAALQRAIAQAQERTRRLQAREAARWADAVSDVLSGCTVRIPTGPVSTTVEVPRRKGRGDR